MLLSVNSNSKYLKYYILNTSKVKKDFSCKLGEICLFPLSTLWGKKVIVYDKHTQVNCRSKVDKIIAGMFIATFLPVIVPVSGLGVILMSQSESPRKIWKFINS